MHKIFDIIQNTKQIYQSDNSLRILCDMERVLDSLNIYAFKNWELGELASGPILKRYWVICEFFWPHKLMPDPSGAKRLLRNDILVEYEKSELVHSRPVYNYDDFEPGTKMPKMDKKSIWLVRISMPRHLLNDVLTGTVDVGDSKLDFTELDHAYDADLNKAAIKDNDEGEEGMDPQMAPPPVPGPPGGSFPG